MRRATGFAIVSAIFILVVLAALGAFILNVFTNQQIGSVQDIQGARAYQAARAGIEWGLYQVQSTAAYNFGYTSTNPNLRSCANASGSFNFATTGATTLGGFTVTVACAATVDGSGGPTIYDLTSTACNQPSGGSCPNTTDPGPLYVERRLTVSF